MVHIERTNRLVDAFLAKTMLDSLESYYPDFGFWYVNKAMPGIVVGTDVLLVAREHEQIVGVALGKAREGETKLRCVRVAPSHQGKGTGLHLIDRMLHELDADRPHCTVSEEMVHMYSRAFINRYGFNLSRVDKGRYRRNKLEYVFNEPTVFAPSVM
jgi:GNAT superfamily N-acetyltransferase